MLDILTVTTANGEKFTSAETMLLTTLINKRFGRDPEAAAAAWRRMLQGTTTTDEFKSLLLRDDRPAYYTQEAMEIRIADLEAKIQDEADNLPAFRRAEAADLALTDDEKAELRALRGFAATGDLLEATKAIMNECEHTGRQAKWDAARAALAKAEGR